MKVLALDDEARSPEHLQAVVVRCDVVLPGPLFCPIDRRGGVRLGHALTGEAIRQIL